MSNSCCVSLIGGSFFRGSVKLVRSPGTVGYVSNSTILRFCYRYGGRANKGIGLRICTGSTSARRGALLGAVRPATGI